MKKKLVAALLCGAMAAGSITVYAETVHAEDVVKNRKMTTKNWYSTPGRDCSPRKCWMALRKRPESRLIIRLSRLISITIC